MNDWYGISTMLFETKVSNKIELAGPEKGPSYRTNP